MSSVPGLSPSEFSSLLDANNVCILDVREPEEIELSSISSSLNVPFMEVELKLDLIRQEYEKTNSPFVVICKSGVRSRIIASFLQELGFSNVFNLESGINGLSKVRVGVVAY